jgi:hypothetical protein
MIPLQHGLILAAILFVLGSDRPAGSSQSAVYADQSGNHDQRRSIGVHRGG